VSGPLVVAHRAGNDRARLVEAAAHADVAEADVHLRRGRLELRHAKSLGPLPLRWERWYLVDPATEPLLLGDLLPLVPATLELMLDLKGADPRLGPATMRATADWRATRPLTVSCRVWRTADALRDTPGVRVLHSVGSARQLRALLRRYGTDALEGVAIDRALLSRGVVALLRERAPHVWSWPVDDRTSARVLAGWGVTGLISDAPGALRPL
jgi:glycerophosphoryl diester phosphodiesterase